MIEWLGQLPLLEKMLFAFAFVGSLLFVAQVLLMLIGGGDDPDGDAPHADSDVAFKVFSVQGTVAFFMMLGWVGLAASRSFGLGHAIAVTLGIVAGVGANLLMARIFQWFKSMQSSGTMDVANAVGRQGEIYLTVKGEEPGKVRVTVQHHLRIFDAVGEGGEELPTGTRVEVVRVVGSSTMVVRKV